jgi:mono/diheme cytochrome c family protein
MSRTIRNITIVLAAALAPSLGLAQDSVDKGKALYAQQCVMCHGSGGRGDGPAAMSLKPKPRDLTGKAYMAGLTDQYLADIVKKGGAGLGKFPLMPSFGAALKEADIRNVVVFLRSLEK